MNKSYLECVVNDRGFTNKPPQISSIAPTLRAQDHGNQPKVIEAYKDGIIIDDTYGFDSDIRIYGECSPTLRAERQGLKVLEENGGDDMNEVKQPEIEVVGMLDISSHDHSRRVHDPEGLCPTLTAVSGGTHHIKIFDISKFRVRKLTPTEYGRLQAFPVDDGWEQVVSDSQAYKQFGNAVTVSVVAAIGGAIKNYLDSIFGAEEETEETDLSDAPPEIKEQIIANAELLEEKETRRTSGLEFFTNEELLAELNRRMTAKA